jgi:misacylated tRNA(Ala) deacylase
MVICGKTAMKKEIDPKMHSAEHILNQTMVRMFSCGRCFSSHIEKKKSKCDYHFNRPLTELEVRQIEKEVNNVIHADMAVTQEFIKKQKAQKHYNIERLPDNAGDNIRIVKIGDYDACPCIGLHVESTKEIGEFKIVSASFENSVLRIRYKLAHGDRKERP